MKKFLSVICFFLVFSGFAQDTLVTQKTSKLLSINHFRSHGIPLTKEDSLNWVFHNNDTLVPVENFPSEGSNKVKVRYEPRDEEFLKIYKDAVFGHTEELQEKSTIKVWKDPIKIFFDPSVPEAHRKDLLQFSEEVATGIDSLRITEVQERAKSNFLVFYRNSEEDFDQEQRISNNRNSGYYISWNGKQQINRGVIKVNAYKVYQEKDQLDLLKYHFFKALGYFHFSPKIPCKGYLSGCPVKRELISEDLEILKYHYSYGMCKGIDMESFDKIHRNSKNTLEEHPNAEIFLVHQN